MARFALSNPGRGGAARGGHRHAALARRRDASSCCASARRVETDAAVKREIETGLAMAALDEDGPAGTAGRGRDAVVGSARTSAIASRRCSSKADDGTFVESRRGGAQAAAARRCSSIDTCPQPLFGHRDDVLRPEPRLGARAGRDRPRHHLRRHGRHQHGARRADDARRLHDLRGADADARITSACRSWWRFPRRSSWRAWRA